MYREPTRTFWKVDPRNRYVAGNLDFQYTLWAGGDVEVPDDPLEFIEMVAEVVWRIETRMAIAQCAEVDRPDLNLFRQVCRRTKARLDPVAAAFGWLRNANHRRRLVNVAESPDTHGILFNGDLETLASIAVFKALGGHLKGGLLVGDPTKGEERRVVNG